MIRRTAAALLLFGAIACNEGPPGPPRATSTALSGSITVQLSGSDSEVAAARELVAGFERANSGVKVTLIPVAQAAEHVTKLTTAFVAGNPPDVFLVNYRRMGGFARRDVIDPVAGVDTAGFYQPTVQAFTFDGRVLCLPQNASSMVVYVNRALFRQAGVGLPGARWTWAEMLATARALAAKNVEAIGFDTSLIRLAPFVWSNGGDIVDSVSAPTKVTLGTSEARAAVEYLLELQKTGLDATQRAAQEPEEAFIAGKLAMLLESRRAVPGLRKTTGLDFDVAPVPAAKSSASALHSDGYCVSKASKNKPLAHAFARYAVSPEGGRILAESGRTVPSVRSLAESAAFLDPTKPPASARVFLDAIPNLRALPSVPGWNEVEEVTEEILGQLFAGRLSLDEAVKRIEETTARELASAS